MWDDSSEFGAEEEYQVEHAGREVTAGEAALLRKASFTILLSWLVQMPGETRLQRSLRCWP
jgi:hypothetical protein